MSIEIHEIKGSQLRYYRMSLVDLKSSIDELEKGKQELENVIELGYVNNEYAIDCLVENILKIKKRLELMLEVYKLKSENTSISDDEFLELAIIKSKQKKNPFEYTCKREF